ncbi:zinc-dependent metalloprotease [Hoyosella sp. G463]|uniref:Zinc-dependent metalloprotease n=1 Tax=Lolliginicoccus lacisalsi TaxID=2742202 RepID=A0A927JCG1_9ACTN|nr:zinc-dependent metalloprotease [Lolliginicoccus lacisalsi]MBD8506669.1 zinc-dependent metalloprotease [Lolliginicoccus lacisalsi]
MTDSPFGFSNPDDDPERRDKDKSGSSGSGGPGRGQGGGEGGTGGGAAGDPFSQFGLGGAGGFDPAALGKMLSQFGQMLSGMGSSMGQGGGEQGSPVNYSLAQNIARQHVGSFSPVTESQRQAVTEAVKLADVWIDGVTTLPSGAQRTAAWTPVDWLDNTLPTWPQLCDPVAEQMSGMWVGAMPEEAKNLIGPMMGIVRQMGGAAFGSQLGQGLGHLAKSVLSSTDIGIPLGPAGTAALLPEAIASFSEGLDVPHREVLVFLAAREAAHQRLYSHVPWLRSRILAAVEEYARGITIALSAIEEAARNLDPSALANPAEIENLLSQGVFEPQTTPEQKAALDRLETMLALIEGWVESVVTNALHDRIPSTPALAETLRRRRASGGPAEQTFANLVGLELRPRRIREATQLWSQLAAFGSMEQRDGVWAHPDLLPDSSDLDDPSGFVDSTVGGGDVSAFDDPIAELQRTEERERSERESRGQAAGTDSDATDSSSGDDRPSKGTDDSGENPTN